MFIPLEQAKLCVNCDIIFDSEYETCPICDYSDFAWLKHWLNKTNSVSYETKNGGE